MNGAMKCEIYCSQWEQFHNCHLHPPSLHFSHCSGLIRQAAFEKKSPWFSISREKSPPSPSTYATLGLEGLLSPGAMLRSRVTTFIISLQPQLLRARRGRKQPGQGDDAIQTQGLATLHFLCSSIRIKIPRNKPGGGVGWRVLNF